MFLSSFSFVFICQRYNKFFNWQNIFCSQGRTRTGYRSRRIRQPYNVSRPNGYGPWCLGDSGTIPHYAHLTKKWLRNYVVLQPLWYSPWLVKPDINLLYQQFHMRYHRTSHRIGHTIRWWTETCSQDRSWTCSAESLQLRHSSSVSFNFTGLSVYHSATWL